MARRKSTRRTPAKHPAKGKFLLQKKGRRKNTTGNARSNRSFVTTASKRKGFVSHVYNVKGKRVAVDVKKKGAKASPKSASGGRSFKRVPKGSAGGGRFSK